MPIVAAEVIVAWSHHVGSKRALRIRLGRWLRPPHDLAVPGNAGVGVRLWLLARARGGVLHRNYASSTERDFETSASLISTASREAVLGHAEELAPKPLARGKSAPANPPVVALSLPAAFAARLQTVRIGV